MVFHCFVTLNLWLVKKWGVRAFLFSRAAYKRKVMARKSNTNRAARLFLWVSQIAHNRTTSGSGGKPLEPGVRVFSILVNNQIIPMKLVKCKIVLHSAEDYKRVIDALLHIFMSHEAKFEAPRTFIVTCYCNHIQAEKNLDDVLESLRLQCQKFPFQGVAPVDPVASIVDSRIQQLINPTYTVSDSLKGQAAA